MKTFQGSLWVWIWMFSLGLTAAPPRVSLAATLGDLTFLDSLQVGDRTLLLNGMGWREATFLNIRVYGAALYLEKKSNSAEEILKSAPPYAIQMVFKREVSQADIAKAWDEGFQKNCTQGDCAQQKSELQKLKALVSDLKKGDSMSLFWKKNNQIEFRLGQNLNVLDVSADFSKNLLAIWLGKAPPNRSLQAGLLGAAVD